MDPTLKTGLISALTLLIGIVATDIAHRWKRRIKSADIKTDEDETKTKSLRFALDLAQKYVQTNDRLTNLEHAYSQRIENLTNQIVDLTKQLEAHQAQIAGLKAALSECLKQTKST